MPRTTALREGRARDSNALNTSRLHHPSSASPLGPVDSSPIQSPSLSRLVRCQPTKRNDPSAISIVRVDASVSRPDCLSSLIPLHPTVIRAVRADIQNQAAVPSAGPTPSVSISRPTRRFFDLNHPPFDSGSHPVPSVSRRILTHIIFYRSTTLINRPIAFSACPSRLHRPVSIFTSHPERPRPHHPPGPTLPVRTVTLVDSPLSHPIP